MATEEFHRVLDVIVAGSLPALTSVGDALTQAADTVELLSLLKLATGLPSEIGAAVVAAVSEHRRETVICATGLGMVLSCCALITGSAVGEDAATAARASAMEAQAEQQKALQARQCRQRDATARANQLKLEAHAARAAARELAVLASEDERKLALASANVGTSMAAGDSASSSPELGGDLPNGSPTKALRFAPSALSGTQNSGFNCSYRGLLGCLIRLCPHSSNACDW